MEPSGIGTSTQRVDAGFVVQSPWGTLYRSHAGRQRSIPLQKPSTAEPPTIREHGVLASLPSQAVIEGTTQVAASQPNIPWAVFIAIAHRCHAWHSLGPEDRHRAMRFGGLTDPPPAVACALVIGVTGRHAEVGVAVIGAVDGRGRVEQIPS